MGGFGFGSIRSNFGKECNYHLVLNFMSFRFNLLLINYHDRLVLTMDINVNSLTELIKLRINSIKKTYERPMIIEE